VADQLLNMYMRRLTYAIWMLTAILIVLGGLMGCASVQTTVDTGVAQIPGQRVHVTTTVYKW
jgi:hypothetical protein